jgi:hypothetical protein
MGGKDLQLARLGRLGRDTVTVIDQVLSCGDRVGTAPPLEGADSLVAVALN